jgi:endoglucanase
MKTVSAILGAGALALALLAAGSAGAQPPPLEFAPGFAPIDASTQVVEMGRGVNVLGYDPLWDDSSRARFKPEMFAEIHRAGFTNVRVVLQAFSHMDGDGKLPASWLATLDTMVKSALDAGLTVILDEHDFTFCSKDAAACARNLNAFWSQIAPRYKNAPNRLMFEILNEPYGALTPELWNKQLVETLGIIRASNPARNIVIGPGEWNAMERLPDLKLPDDDAHIVVTFHYYHPMTFTHQGASWAGDYLMSLSGVHWGNQAEYEVIQREFDRVKAWSDANKRPIFMGEFGAYEKAPLADRALWTNAVARAAESHGFAWAYWYFDGGFTVYDIDHGKWVEPILNALVP